MTRILVVQTAYLGDVILTTPLLRELRRVRPGSRITVLATPGGVETLAGLSFVDELLPFDKRGAHAGPLGTLRCALRLRRIGFDEAIAAQRSFRSGLLVHASGAGERVGFGGARGEWAYTRPVPWDGSRHAVQRYLALAAPLGGDPLRADPRPELAVPEEARAHARALLEEAGLPAGAPLLAVAPGSIWGTKRWTASGYAEVVRAGAERGLHTVLVGSAAERGLCLDVASGAGIKTAVLAGRTSIPEMTAVIAMSRALVTNDSGSAHVASAVGTPVVVIFGPTVPAFGYAPFGELRRIVEHQDMPCRPCHSHGPPECPLGHHRCMREIEARRVVLALDELLAERSRGGTGENRYD